MNAKPLTLDPAQLEQLLLQQDQQVTRCLETLESIEQCICQNDSAGLMEVLLDPGLDITQLESLRNQQQQIVAAAGFDHEKNGLEACVQALNNPSLSALYQKTQKDWAQFERALALNDRLIRHNQQRVRQSIQLLAGRIGAESNSTYSNLGSSINYDAAQRTLAKV